MPRPLLRRARSQSTTAAKNETGRQRMQTGTRPLKEVAFAARTVMRSRPRLLAKADNRNREKRSHADRHAPDRSRLRVTNVKATSDTAATATKGPEPFPAAGESG